MNRYSVHKQVNQHILNRYFEPNKNVSPLLTDIFFCYKSLTMAQRCLGNNKSSMFTKLFENCQTNTNNSISNV